MTSQPGGPGPIDDDSDETGAGADTGGPAGGATHGSTDEAAGGLTETGQTTSIGGGSVYAEDPPADDDDPQIDHSLAPAVPTVLPPPVLSGSGELIGEGESVEIERHAELADEPATSSAAGQPVTDGATRRAGRRTLGDRRPDRLAGRRILGDQRPGRRSESSGTIGPADESSGTSGPAGESSGTVGPAGESSSTVRPADEPSGTVRPTDEPTTTPSSPRLRRRLPARAHAPAPTASRRSRRGRRPRVRVARSGPSPPSRPSPPRISSSWRRPTASSPSTRTGRAGTRASRAGRSSRCCARSTSTPPATRRSQQALRDLHERPWRRMLPDVVVVRAGQARERARPRAARAAGAGLGRPRGRRPRAAGAGGALGRAAGDRRRARRRGDVHPARRPAAGLAPAARAVRRDGESERPLVVTPDRLELPEPLQRGRAWGFMTQLYSVRSRLSWGLGDLADLAELADWSARDHGAGLRAGQPAARGRAGAADGALAVPADDAAVRQPDLPAGGGHPRGRLHAARPTGRSSSGRPRRMRGAQHQPRPARPGRRLGGQEGRARDGVRAAALDARAGGRFEAFCDREGQGLVDFATWCALAERYGLPMSTLARRTPATRARRRSRQIREELADAGRVPHVAAVVPRRAARRRAADGRRGAGCRSGSCTTSPSASTPRAPTTWALAGVLARRVTVGAPPDAFNQQGQDWSQPPWRPDRLAELGYAPFRDMIRTVLRHAGGLRVDHVIGLFRLWWVPDGLGPRARAPTSATTTRR